MGNDAQQPHHSATGPSAPGTGEPARPAAILEGIGLRKKSVLLVDSNLRSRQSRAKVMRTKGVRVDCVGNADAARVRLAAETYNLVLVDLGHDVDGAESLVHEIRTQNSRQLVGFLVGSPLFVAQSLNGSNPRPRRAPEPAIVASGEKPSTPTAAGIDFGQRIRDAEAAEKEK
jgi:CheY-like chemotaxis protein